MDPVPLCSQCKTRAANWKCRGCDFIVCDNCPEGNTECPRCNLRSTESDVLRAWFMQLPGRPDAASGGPQSSTASNSSSTSTSATPTHATGLPSDRSESQMPLQDTVSSSAAAGATPAVRDTCTAQSLSPEPPQQTAVVCRLCHKERQKFDSDDPNRWAHREFCTAKEPPPPVQMDQMARCLYCVLMIPRDRAMDHIMICERVPKEDQKMKNLLQVGSEMRNRSDNYTAAIKFQLKSAGKYCGRMVMQEIGWVCGPVGALYGLPCANCMRDVVERNKLPPGEILNSNKDFATIGPDGLFECGRNMYRSPNQLNRFADDAALTCSYKDQLICDACMRISCEPVFSYLLPVIERIANA